MEDSIYCFYQERGEGLNVSETRVEGYTSQVRFRDHEIRITLYTEVRLRIGIY